MILGIVSGQNNYTTNNQNICWMAGKLIKTGDIVQYNSSKYSVTRFEESKWPSYNIRAVAVNKNNDQDTLLFYPKHIDNGSVTLIQADISQDNQQHITYSYPPSYYMGKAYRQRKSAIITTAMSAIPSSIMLGVGASQGNTGLIIAGGVIMGVGGLASIILELCALHNDGKAAETLSRITVTSEGVKIHF